MAFCLRSVCSKEITVAASARGYQVYDPPCRN
jgi:hypothetical protein